jgi:hypothetical protein
MAAQPQHEAVRYRACLSKRRQVTDGRSDGGPRGSAGCRPRTGSGRPARRGHVGAGWRRCAGRRRARGGALIREAVAATRHRWPEVPTLGMVTFVDPAKVRHKRDPGRCFRRAGFVEVGRTAGGLVALQLLPDAMPAPAPALGEQMPLRL